MGEVTLNTGAYGIYGRVLRNLGLDPAFVQSMLYCDDILHVRVLKTDGGLPIPDGNGGFLTEFRDFDSATLIAAEQ